MIFLLPVIFFFHFVPPQTLNPIRAVLSCGKSFAAAQASCCRYLKGILILFEDMTSHVCRFSCYNRVLKFRTIRLIKYQIYTDS